MNIFVSIYRSNSSESNTNDVSFVNLIVYTYLQAYTALEEKCLAYSKKSVLLPAGEVSEPWYMRINSNGTVPALVHGDKIVDDSQKIIEYLEEAFPGEILEIFNKFSLIGYDYSVLTTNHP